MRRDTRESETSGTEPSGFGTERRDVAASRGAADEDPPRADTVGASLALRARAGDRGAFAGLYERFAPTVHGVLVSMVSVDEARDLCQEVFLTALRTIGRLTEPERVGPWLCTIARNRARDLYRARGRRQPTLELEGLDEAGEPVARAEVVREPDAASRALDALRELPEAYRETLALRLVEGLTGPEIAERMGMTHGSVRVNLHRGMKLLRKRLERDGVDLGGGAA